MSARARRRGAARRRGSALTPRRSRSGARCATARARGARRAALRPREVGRTIHAYGVTVAMFSPGHSTSWSTGRRRACAALRTMFATATCCRPGHATAHARGPPRDRFFNAYGPTETHDHRVVLRGARRRAGPVGADRPTAGQYHTSTWWMMRGDRCRRRGGRALRRRRRGGPRLPRAGRADRREVLRRARFRATHGTSLYRTGDMVPLADSGNLEFHGRLDDQVKIQGYRVEPAEVAAVLSGHRDVLAAEVLVRQGPTGRQAVDRFRHRAIRHGRGTATAVSSRRLPEYMIPAQIVTVDQMSSHAIGKVDRDALAGLYSRRAGRPPATSAEETIGRRWREILGVGDVAAE